MDDEIDEVGYDAIRRFDRGPKKVSRVLKSRVLYSNAVNDKIEILSIDPKNTFMYGSSTIAALANVAGDYDIWETFDNGETVEDLVKGIRKIARKFKSGSEKFFIEFKSGICKDAILDIGYLEYGKIINYNYSEIMKNINSKSYLHELKKYVKKKISLDEWMELWDRNRKIYTLRWTLDEIIKNKKKMPNGKFITLDLALLQPIITKIEVIMMVNGRLVAFSNFFDNKTSANSENFELGIKFNYYRMLKDKKYMKVIKRMFAIQRNFIMDKGTIENIYRFLVSDVGRLGRVSTDIKAIIEVINTKQTIPIKVAIRLELDSKIDELASISINDLDLRKVDEEINDALVLNSKKKLVELLNSITKYIDKIVNDHAYAYLNNNGYLSDEVKKQYMSTSTKVLMLY
jgi:hypothetical protein